MTHDLDDAAAVEAEERPNCLEGAAYILVYCLLIVGAIWLNGRVTG